MKAATDPIPTGQRRPPLLSEFPLPAAGEWRAAAEALLKGAAFEKKLLTRTWEGIELRPIYQREDIANLPGRDELPGLGNRRRGNRTSGYLQQPWLVSQELPLATPEEFNAVALHELARGQSELNVLCDMATLAGLDPDQAEPGEVGACGLSLATLADFERAFAGIHLPMVSVYLRAGAAALPAAALFLAFARQRGVAADALRGCIEIDPLAMLAWNGSLPVSLERAYQEMTALTRHAVNRAPGLQTIAVTTHGWHDAGANAVQELAFALATGVEYLRALAARNVPVADAARHVRFAMAAGSNFFMEVAKFRAARVVWAQAVRALAGDAGPAPAMHLHVRTATANKTVLDAHGNILRTTTEALAAVLGACDSLHVGPFDEIFRVPDEFARRLARNTHTILAEECDLTRVIDPAGGSYYVEALTDELARRAWAMFQEIENSGGMARALAAGRPQQTMVESARARAQAVARRRTVIIGANQYPNTDETLPGPDLPDYAAIQRRRAKQIETFRTSASAADDTEVLNRLALLLEAPPETLVDTAVDAVLHGATLGEIARTLRANDTPAPPITPVRLHRLARPFEKLREAAAAFAAEAGHPPLVFQANIGPSRRYRLRADWTSGFFAVGGFRVLADRDFAGPAEAAEAALASGARVIVITAPDDTYPECVEPLARALKAGRPEACVLVAGSPGEFEPAWRAAGVDEFVNVSTNALDLLSRLLTSLEVLP